MAAVKAAMASEASGLLRGCIPFHTMTALPVLLLNRLTAFPIDQLKYNLSASLCLSLKVHEKVASLTG